MKAKSKIDRRWQEKQRKISIARKLNNGQVADLSFKGILQTIYSVRTYDDKNIKHLK
ncbi:hypothetical protein [Sporosalibacterium faouarense]|uniref:hypothetical protein n=1 Tax=Sporosalibacterium faouarense TaxID=516123 RepID=UPI00192B30D4|nr:hypothetical protein [Sporosalibacterium faouarense]